MKVAGKNYFIKGSVCFTVGDFEALFKFVEHFIHKVIPSSYLVQADRKLNRGVILETSVL